MFDDTRADWDARPPQGPIYTVPIASRTEKFAHWNGGQLGITMAKDHDVCLAAVKAIQAEHMHDDPDHGWSDIGYNGLVCPAHARLIEGRGRDAVGAHCPGHNRTGVAVQFMLGKGETATPAMFARARRFFDDCETAARHALKPMGHRDGYATECPGDQIEAWVKAGMPGAQEDDMQLDDIVTVTRADGEGTEDIPFKTWVNRMQFVYAQTVRNLKTDAALLAAVKAGQQAGPTADAQAIVDELATRLTKETS